VKWLGIDRLTTVGLIKNKLFKKKTPYWWVYNHVLYRYGVKEIKEKNDKIFISLSLSYSPMGLTLKNKFGNSPVRYMRTKLDNDEEFKIMKKVVKRYKFNLVDEDLEEMHRLQTSTKKLYLEEPSQMSNEDDDEDDKVDSEIQNLNGPVSPDGQVLK
jgi:hypothetical protein